MASKQLTLLVSAACLLGCPATVENARQYPQGEAPFAINGVDVAAVDDADGIYQPHLVGPWQPLFFPENANYMNDHTVYRHTDGRWHIIGIGNDLPTDKFQLPWRKEIQFVHGSADTLLGEYTTHPPVAKHPVDDKLRPFEQLKFQPNTYFPAWAPHCIRFDQSCYLFYGPQDFLIEKSSDMHNWEIVNHFNNGLPIKGPYDLAKFDFRNGGADIRDYMVLRTDADTWLLYQTGIDKQSGAASVTVYESKGGLENWQYKGEAITFKGMKTKPWSSAESPFVFKRGNYYYLSLTYTSTGGGYHQTLMFRSRDPLNFGNYGGLDDQFSKQHVDFVGGYGAHAPEIVYDPDAEKWYMTTCGWSWQRVTKPQAASGGLAITEIEWKKSGTFLTNHDFEYGAFTGWQRQGDAFELSLANFEFDGQLLGQNGSFFASSLFFEDSEEETFKVGGVKPDATGKGKLTSPEFTLADKPTLDFLVMGGNKPETLYIALVDVQSGEILAKTSGNERHQFERRELDISRFGGRRVYLEVVDNDGGDWGHISVDDINVTIVPSGED